MDIIGKAKFSWRLLAAVVLALAGVIVIVLVARDGSTVKPAPISAESRGLATPSELSSVLADETAGRQVFLNRVQLSPASKEDQYLARGARGQHMLVIAAGKAPQLDGPAVANVRGITHVLPSERVLRRDWKLDKKQRKLVAGQRFYIAAQEIEVQPGE